MNNKVKSNLLWDFIHCVGKTYNPNANSSKQSFICVFECLTVLLPNKEYRNTLHQFIQQTPIEPYLSSNQKAFEWTYKLHSFVNLVRKRSGQLVSDITLEQANEKYKFLPKNRWGNAYWFAMHYLACNIPIKIPNNLAVSYKAFIVCMNYLIPCGECQFHMNEFINHNEIDSYLTTRNRIFQYGWYFHNKVNERIKTPMRDYKEMFELYLNP